MNPQYIFVSGETFYFLKFDAVINGDLDLAHASYEAMHMDAFGNAGGQPCRVGASYSKHFAVNGLYQLASG